MRRSGAILAFTLMLLIGVFFLYFRLLQFHNLHVQQAHITEMQNDTTTVTPLNQNTLKQEPVPISISIPKYHMDAPIRPVGLDREGRMATIPSAKTIAWYAYGATPGASGNAIFAGHRDWNGALGSFWGLENLQSNDLVCITLSSGTELTFKATSVHEYKASIVPSQVMDTSGPERITLITCVGDFVRSDGGYQSRVVVILHKISNAKKG